MALTSASTFAESNAILSSSIFAKIQHTKLISAKWYYNCSALNICKSTSRWHCAVAFGVATQHPRRLCGDVLAIIGGADATVRIYPVVAFMRAQFIRFDVKPNVFKSFIIVCVRVCSCTCVYLCRCAYAKCKRFRKTFRYNLIASRGIFSTRSPTARLCKLVHSGRAPHFILANAEKVSRPNTTSTVDSQHSESNFLSMAFSRSLCVSCSFIRQFGSTKVFMFDGIQERF